MFQIETVEIVFFVDFCIIVYMSFFTILFLSYTAPFNVNLF